MTYLTVKNARRNSTSDNLPRFPKHGAYIKCRLVFGIVAHFLTKKHGFVIKK